MLSSQQTTTLWPGMQLEITQDNEVVRSETPEPHPSWKFVDGAGHGHFYGETERRYPTLEWVVLPCTMGHGPECTAEGYYRCPLCHERISPRVRTPVPVVIPGPARYRLTYVTARVQTVYEFGHDRFQELQVAVLKAVQEELASCIRERTFTSGE